MSPRNERLFRKALRHRLVQMRANVAMSDLRPLPVSTKEFIDWVSEFQLPMAAGIPLSLTLRARLEAA